MGCNENLIENSTPTQSGYHLGEEQGGLGTGGEDGEVYYQPEPTLLTIASGEQGIVEEQQVGRRQHQYPIENELLSHDF